MCGQYSISYRESERHMVNVYTLSTRMSLVIKAKQNPQTFFLHMYPVHASLWINPYVALQGLTDLGVSSAEVLWLPEPRSSRRDRGVGGLDSHLIGRFSSLMAESSLLYIWNAQRSYKVYYFWLLVLCINIFQWILIVKKAELPIKTCFYTTAGIYMYIVTLINIHP